MRDERSQTELHAFLEHLFHRARRVAAIAPARGNAVTDLRFTVLRRTMKAAHADRLAGAHDQPRTTTMLRMQTCDHPAHDRHHIGVVDTAWRQRYAARAGRRVA